MSIAGGAWRAFARAEEVGANCLQVFVKSNVQWRFPRLADADVERFRQEQERTGIRAVIAHACYLANPASPDKAVLGRSIEDLRKELEYTARYGMKWLVLHPGNHLGSGVAAGVAQAAAVIAEALGETRDAGVLVEMTAGAGTAIGSSFEEIAEIIAAAGGSRRLGVCLDTAHAFGAGYDIRSKSGYARMKRRLRSLGLLSRVKAIHANDSRAPLGSRVDRHEHVGKGHIGREGFANLMRDTDFADVPKILETPKGMCGRRPWDAVSIALLRRLALQRG
jgi:deoxyribonuclease-4